jgi:predicted lipoprotein with Yx(FWY)xxD motif
MNTNQEEMMEVHTMSPTRWLRRGVLPVIAVGVLALAGCGSNGGSSSSATSGSGSSGDTVTVRHDGGQTVLTTASGRTLYMSDQEHGHVLCTSGDCEAIWNPLTVAAGGRLRAPSTVASELGTVKRPDGSRQVTLEGSPLYTFSFDHSAGQVNGDGQKDSFDGTNFSWHAATPTGGQSTGQAAGTPSSPYSSGGSSGGYHY